MKLIYLIMHDGARHLATSPVPDDFDVQAWANERAASLQVLGVVRVEEDLYQEPSMPAPEGLDVEHLGDLMDGISVYQFKKPTTEN